MHVLCCRLWQSINLLLQLLLLLSSCSSSYVISLPPLLAALNQLVTKSIAIGPPTDRNIVSAPICEKVRALLFSADRYTRAALDVNQSLRNIHLIEFRMFTAVAAIVAIAWAWMLRLLQIFKPNLFSHCNSLCLIISVGSCDDVSVVFPLGFCSTVNVAVCSSHKFIKFHCFCVVRSCFPATWNLT